MVGIRDVRAMSQPGPVRDASSATISEWGLRTIEPALILNEVLSATSAMFLRERTQEGTTSGLENQLDRRRRTPSA